MHTYQLDPDEEAQEAGLKHFEDHMEQAKFHPCHLINVEVAIDPFLLKQSNILCLRVFLLVK